MYIEKRMYIVLLCIYGKMNYSSFLPFDLKCKIIYLSENPETDLVHKQYSLNKTNKRILVSCLINAYPYFICSFKKYNRVHTFLISTYNKKYLLSLFPVQCTTLRNSFRHSLYLPFNIENSTTSRKVNLEFLWLSTLPAGFCSTSNQQYTELFSNVRFVFDRTLPIDHHFSIQQNVPIQVKAKNPTPIIGMEFKSLVRY